MTLSRKKSISFLSDSPRIVLVFGPQKKEITIHEKILQQFQFFADALQKVKPESGVIRFDYSTHNNIAGDWLAQWLYFEQLPHDESDVSRLKGVVGDVVAFYFVWAYALATHLKMEERANRLADVFMDFPLSGLWSSLYTTLRRFAGGSTKLEDLILTIMARSIRSMGWDKYTSSVDAQLVNSISNTPDLAVGLAKHLAKDDGTSMADLKKTNKCLFHIHEKSKKC